MDTSKAYQRCDIKRRATVVSGGEESFSETTVYASIPCYVRPSKAGTAHVSTEQSNVQTVYVTVDR